MGKYGETYLLLPKIPADVGEVQHGGWHGDQAQEDISKGHVYNKNVSCSFQELK